MKRPGNYQCDKCKRWFKELPKKCPSCGGVSFYDPDLTETFGRMFGFDKIGGR
jgi:hypothetical protein